MQNPIVIPMLSETKNIRAEFAFQLQNASVHGGELLISDPCKWKVLEDEHVSANLAKTAILGDSKF